MQYTRVGATLHNGSGRGLTAIDCVVLSNDARRGGWSASMKKSDIGLFFDGQCLAREGLKEG
jgi:hypothetical protein